MIADLSLLLALAGPSVSALPCPQAPPSLPKLLRDRLAAGGTCVTVDGVALAVFWVTSDLPPAPAGPREVSTARIRYGALRRGEGVGAVLFTRRWCDARGQEIRPGGYALHYAVQPLLKDHVDTTEARDFLVLVPAGRGSSDALPEKDLIEASRVGTRLHHPLVLELLGLPEGTSKSGTPSDRVLTLGRDHVLLALRLQSGCASQTALNHRSVRIISHAAESN